MVHIDAQFGRLIGALAMLITVASATAGTSKEVIRAVKASTDNPYLLGRAELDGKIYSDRNYALTKLPEGLRGAILVRTSNEDDNVATRKHLELEISQDAVVYVCWDHRAHRLARWLIGWQRLDGQAVTDDTAYRIYRKSFAAGKVTLGGNHRRETGAAGNYFVIIKPGKKPQDGLKPLHVVDEDIAETSAAAGGSNSSSQSVLPHVPQGFAVKLYAREPLVHNPAALCFDAKGRMVIGHGPQYRNPTPKTPGDSVIILVDEDDDGQADRTKVFATGFNSIQGLAWKGQWLWVANSPELTKVRDIDGDDRADEYVRVYTDLGNLEHALHGLNWAPDGKLYMSKGNSKGHNRPEQNNGRVAPHAFRELFGLAHPEGAEDFPPPVTFSPADYFEKGKGYHNPADDWGRQGGVLRCDPSGEGLEIVCRGHRNPWDIAMDDGFNWLGTDNDQDQGDKIFMPIYGAHFGWGHPWSYDWYGQDHAPTMPASGPLFEGSGTGIAYYTAPQFPPSMRNVFFINDWLRGTTYVYRPKWDGALMLPAGPQLLEPFATRQRGLFKPTDIEVGPDGALYVNGWGHDYGVEWDVRNGQRVQVNEGRVFRIWYAGNPLPRRNLWYRAKYRLPYSKWTTAQLIEDLEHHVLSVWRVNAQDELIRRGGTVVQPLTDALESGRLSKGQETWAAWALGRIAPGAKSIDKWFARLLSAPTSRLNIRIQAVRILAHRLEAPATAVAQALRDPEPRIRTAAVQAIWQMGDRSGIEPLKALVTDEQDRVTFYCAWQALRDLASADQRRAMLKDTCAGVRFAALMGLMDKFEVSKAEVLGVVEADDDLRIQRWGLKWMLAGRPPGTISNAPQRPGSSDRLSTADVIRRLRETRSRAVRTGLVSLLQRNKLRGGTWDQLHEIYQQLTSSKDITDDQSAIFLRALSHDPRVLPMLWSAAASESDSLRHAAIDGLSLTSDLGSRRSFLLEKIRGMPSPRLVSLALEALNRHDRSWQLDVSTANALTKIYKSADDPRIRSHILHLLQSADLQNVTRTATARERMGALLRHAATDPDPRIHAQVAPLAKRLGERIDVPLHKPVTVEQVLPLLSQGKPERGRDTFFDRRRANCALCHRVGGQGHGFAPSLSGIGARAKPAEILESILHPSKKITEGFAITQLITNDGKVVAGVVRHESPTAIQLFQADGRLIEIAKRDVEERVLSKTSVMPNNFGLMLAPQELADMVVWLAQQKRGSGFQPRRGETPRPRADGKFAVDLKTDRVTITHAGRPVADYVFSDPKILRPYFANVHGPSGAKITRNHPPVRGKDATDHATMHPGIWFGFGDISGVDFWRNKGRIEHVRFVSAPNATKDGVTFATKGRLLLPDGKPLATLTSRCAISARPAGWLLIWDAAFHADQRDVTFGDQEEMGFGARLATALTEKSGGTILNSNGKKTAGATWGQPAAWCDYSGTKDGRRIGITLMPAPTNFRESWWHNRDYGVFVANPFGRAAMKQGAKSAVTVKKGDSLRLVFGAMLHDANDFDPATEYRHFVKTIR